MITWPLAGVVPPRNRSSWHGPLTFAMLLLVMTVLKSVWLQWPLTVLAWMAKVYWPSGIESLKFLASLPLPLPSSAVKLVSLISHLKRPWASGPPLGAGLGTTLT